MRRATVVNRFQTEGMRVPPFTADLAVNEDVSTAEGREQRRASIQDVGDLSVFRGVEEVDATNYFVTVARGILRPGAEAALLFYRKDHVPAQMDWAAPDLETRFPPDATYRHGEWRGRGNLIFR